MRRVVVTGMGGITALGSDWPTIKAEMQAGKTGVRTMTDWDFYKDMNTRLGAPISDFNIDKDYPRKKLRSMGRVSKLALYATERALASAGLQDDPILGSSRMGVSYGSSFGSTGPMVAFAELISDGTMNNLNATSYIKMMSHSAAVNLSVFYGLKGRIIPTSTACTSGSMGIGAGYEAIKFGVQDVMIAGGAEELCASMAAVFDALYATSVHNDQPKNYPRPFDQGRDGLVTGEGAGTLILEDYDRAVGRGAKIYAEIVGYDTNTDGTHVTQPEASTQKTCLLGALENAGISVEALGVVNGHGTATDRGDISEAEASLAVYGGDVPFHTLKGHFGHTLGASGAIEAWLGIEMMHDGWHPPIANLDTVDEACMGLNYIRNTGQTLDVEYMASNNFAFGGINTSLIIKRL